MNSFILPGTIVASSLLLGAPAAVGSNLPVALSEETPEVSWMEINLETPGSLGVEILYKTDRLSDVEYLRVTGRLNAKDWTTISNLTSIISLDLSGASSADAGIPDGCFYGRTSLKEIKLPQDVPSIGTNGFRECGLVEIIVPESVKTMGEYTFYNCDSLIAVTLPGINTIPASCFAYSDNLETVKLGEGVVIIDTYAFCDCQKLKSINFPEGLTTINYEAFWRTYSLEELVFPSSIASIGYSAFNGCGAKRVEFGVSTVNISEYAFNGMNNLEELVLPVGDYSYYRFMQHSPNLKRIVCLSATPPSVSDSFNNTSLANVTLVVPEFAIVQYKLHSFWGKADTISEGAESSEWIVWSDLELISGHRMSGTPSVRINANGNLRVLGTDPMPMEKFTVISNLTNNTFGQFINEASLMTANSAELRAYTAQNKWYFISFPCDVKMEDITHSDSRDFVFRSYDGEYRAANGSGASWKNVPADGVLEAGKGYIYQAQGAGYLMVNLQPEAISSLLSHSTRTMEVKAWESENAANAGWNYIGNPFPSYYDMYYASINCPITVWDGSKYVAYSLTDDTVVLAPMQAFFMQQSDLDAEISFDTTGTQFTTEILRDEALKAKAIFATSAREIFNLSLRNDLDETADMTRLVVNPDASEDYETACDAAKFFGEGDCASLYTVAIDGTPMAINERPLADEYVALGGYIAEAGKYEISLDKASRALEFHDALLGKDIVLNQGERYAFEAERGQIDGRFSIRLNAGIPSNTDEIELNHCSATPVKGGIVVEGYNGANVEIYAIDGILAANVTLLSGSEKISLGSGVYVVIINGRSFKCVVSD